MDLPADLSTMFQITPPPAPLTSICFPPLDEEDDLQSIIGISTHPAILATPSQSKVTAERSSIKMKGKRQPKSQTLQSPVQSKTDPSTLLLCSGRMPISAQNSYTAPSTMQSQTSSLSSNAQMTLQDYLSSQWMTLPAPLNMGQIIERTFEEVVDRKTSGQKKADCQHTVQMLLSKYFFKNYVIAFLQSRNEQVISLDELAEACTRALSELGFV